MKNCKKARLPLPSDGDKVFFHGHSQQQKMPMEKKPHRKRGYSDRPQISVVKNIASLLPALSLARLTFAAPEGS
jgi:hypothetical protein